MKYFLIFVLFFCFQSQGSFAFEKTKLWESLKPGRYTTKIEDLTDRWLRPQSHVNVNEKEGELKIQSILTTDDNTYVGIMAKTQIVAKLEDTLKVLKDIANYQGIYPGLDAITFNPSPPDEYEIHWKFSGPLGTHTIYDTAEKVFQSKGGKGTLIYQLKKSDDVLETDGFIFLEQDGPLIKYLSVDFFNAKWGVAGTFFKDQIWKTSFENTEKATLAIKQKAEQLSHPNEALHEKVVVTNVGLDDRDKQKTFEDLLSEIIKN